MVEFISLGSAMTASAFSALLARQYLSKRRLYQLIWTVSMSLFALGAFLEFVMSAVVVSGPLFDLYYLSIGPQVGLLGTGVVYLLKPRLGRYILYAVTALSALLLLSVLVEPVNIIGLATSQSGTVMSYQQWFQSSVVWGIYYSVSAFAAGPRDITMILNSLGSLLVVGGGILSYVVDRRRRYALVIALGALMNAIGGILLAFLNYPDLFLYFEFLGIVLLFLGFLMSSTFVSRSAAEVAETVVAPAQA